ncbi:MAG: Phosphatase/phosphohexomutase [Candidatus Woesebacteria bacterium GW2011_GWC2_40_30]|nr:MAG: Phosphatase/phosphohexomutase [Candidatus Woesebacteria bacterium GW2011_GWC2_40_30]
MKLSAVIFDMDGTILEDEDEYGKAFNKVLKNLNVDSKTDTPQEKGIGVKENWDLLIKKYSINTDKTPEALAKETQNAYLASISEVTVRAGFDDFLEKLKDSGVRVALATSNIWEQTEKILDTVNLRDAFDVITTADEVLYNKPDPDIFTDECLVIEDSPSGVEAARRAGMKVVAIFSGGDLQALSKADLVVEGFSEITAQAIDQL